MVKKSEFYLQKLGQIYAFYTSLTDINSFAEIDRPLTFFPYNLENAIFFINNLDI